MKEHMNIEEVMETYSKMPVADQALCLALYGYELTILARDAYEPGTDDVKNPRWLRRLNEIQHRILGHILKLFNDDRARYPDDVFLNIVIPEENSFFSRSFCTAINACRLKRN
jgi:hypothetical protein